MRTYPFYFTSLVFFVIMIFDPGPAKSLRFVVTLLALVGSIIIAVVNTIKARPLSR